MTDGLEFNEIAFSIIEKDILRIDSEYYSKKNLRLQKIIEKLNGETIANCGVKIDCSAFYPSITEFYSKDHENIPFLRVNEIIHGLISITNNTVFLPHKIIEANNKTIALAYPGDIIIAKGGNTLAKVGLVTNDFPIYATCRDLIVLHTKKLQKMNKYYLWAFLHCSYGQGLLWRSASQTGQPHLTLSSIADFHVPEFPDSFQDSIEEIYKQSVECKREAEKNYSLAEQTLLSHLGLTDFIPSSNAISIKNISESFLATGRIDAEYYQPKYYDLFNKLKKFNTKKLGGQNGIVSIKKSIEPGSDAYCKEGIPFVRVSNMTKYGITNSEIKLSRKILPDIKSLYPRKNTILFSKDGSVGIAYKIENDSEFVTSGALLHLRVRNPSEIFPDYVTLVLNSIVIQLQAERDSNGAIIQHWKPSDIENAIIPVLDVDTQREISTKVQKSFVLHRRSEQLLDYTKQAIEIAIEQGEDNAIVWLKKKGVDG